MTATTTTSVGRDQNSTPESTLASPPSGQHASSARPKRQKTSQDPTQEQRGLVTVWCALCRELHLSVDGCDRRRAQQAAHTLGRADDRQAKWLEMAEEDYGADAYEVPC